MAVTEILLSDPITTLVTKTNTIASNLGDASTLSTTATNLVAAINEINTQVNKVDSADVISLIQANAMDSAEVLALIRADSGETSIMSNFQGDSSTGVALDSSQGRFFVPTDGIDSDMIKSLTVRTRHLTNDLINADKIADDVINSEHYVDGSIDTAHIANDQITEALMADDAIGSTQLKSVSTLLIKDSAGSTLKTLHGAGA